MRITEQQRRQNEDRIRAASDRLLRGEIPPGGGCDVKTLAKEAGVTRAALYSTYLHLKEEFEARRDRMHEAGEVTDPRAAQIERLKEHVAELKKRVADRDSEITALKEFRTTAVSRLAAQHDEITRLRTALAGHSNVRGLSRSPDHTDG
ncbi:hypothetical protein [Saccharothrix obliqua]|uniref:hypothetical protein n=1 Tax=Saccharothrix obliqua TaxID=2861747 RepID=UPI001C5DC9A7|nr:hypothetical protein [Saccharothrix obliqua]MBW4719803.1 hypothetical protein [Saccharothrix obliqua]